MWWQNKLAVLALLLGFAIFGNLVFLDYKILTHKAQDEITSPSKIEKIQTSQPTATSSAVSFADFQTLIDQKIANLKEELSKTLATPVPKPQAKTVSPPAQPRPLEIYINFGSGGSTTLTSWTDLAGTDITFDVANYQGAKALYFQANLKSDAPDRATFARIYDATHSVGVQGSEMSYAGLTSKLTESGSLTFFSGRLTLRVQIHSLNGNLATIESPKIRIVY